MEFDLNALARELLHFIERVELDPGRKDEIFRSGIEPCLVRASQSFAELLEIKRPPVRENRCVERASENY